MNIEGHEIIFDRKRRFYKEDLTNRDFSLETSTPRSITIDGKELKESSWSMLLPKLILFLFAKHPDKKYSVGSFKTDWTNMNIFSSTKRINSKKLYDDLYVNVNHTALHFVWLIQDLLDFFEEDKSKVTLYIHRAPYIEPKECRDFFKNRFKLDFADFMRTKYNKSEKQIQKIIYNIEYRLNPILANISLSYNDFMLFDNLLTFENYASKFIQTIESNPKTSINNMRVYALYMEYLKQYYSDREY